MLVLVYEGQIAGTTDPASAPYMPLGFTVYEVPDSYSLDNIYYNRATDQVELKPPKPADNAYWSIDHWEVPEVYVPPVIVPFQATDIFQLAREASQYNLAIMAEFMIAVYADVKNDTALHDSAVSNIIAILEASRNDDENPIPGTEPDPING